MPEAGAATVVGRTFLQRWISSGELPRPVNPEEALGLVSAASAEGLAGLLHDQAAGFGGAWPAEALEALRQRYHLSFARGVQQLDLAARVMALLGSCGVRSLPMKGAALAERHYESVAQRPMADVDILVLDDWEKSVGCLSKAGFREIERGDHAWAFHDPSSGHVLELHHSVTSCAGFFPLDREGLWDRRLTKGGQVRLVPSDADLLVQLSLHAAFQHGLSLSLVQYLDLRRIMEGELDVELLFRIARAAHAEGALAGALLAAEKAVGLPLERSFRLTLEHRLPPFLSRRLRAIVEESDAFPRRDRLLARLRWDLARGRRIELLWRTVAAEPPGSGKSAWERGSSAVRRTARLLRGLGHHPRGPLGPGRDIVH
jgi:hypothetical protein